jgi:RNA polymerase sigma-70 factor, ECF subfamily
LSASGRLLKPCRRAIEPADGHYCGIQEFLKWHATGDYQNRNPCHAAAQIAANPHAGNALGGRIMALFQDLLVEQLPHLRAYAMRLARNRAVADDLVQETTVRALCNIDKFAPGTNMKAWLSTILRNQFYDELRSRSLIAAYAAVPRPMEHDSEQESRVEMKELEREFAILPAAQREALSLVGANGFSYEEAAEIVGCPQGTIKSRVCRARATLEQRLRGEGPAASPAPDPQPADFRLAA